jgi:hypothetical protein
MRPVELVSQTSTSPQYSTLSFPIILNRADTAAFHKECKKHKCNVTPVVNAILVLADVETTMWWGLRSGQEKFNVVKEMFETADLFPVPINGMDRVSQQSDSSLRMSYDGYFLPLAISFCPRALQP